jgi:hypothetical protein
MKKLNLNQLPSLEKDKIQTGDILLYSSKGFIGKAIQFFTRSKVNHVSIAIEIWGEMYVYESIEKGFVPVKLEDSIKGKDIFVLKPDFKVDKKAISLLTTSMAGHHRYDFASLLFFQVIYQVTKRVAGKGLWIGRKDANASKRLYCSEAVAYIYNTLHGIMEKWWKYFPAMFLEEAKFRAFKLNK